MAADWTVVPTLTGRHARLEPLQVDWIQGYHIGRPVPLSTLDLTPAGA